VSSTTFHFDAVVERMKSLSPFTLLAALFLLLGFVLRMYGLDIQSLCVAGTVLFRRLEADHS